MLPPRRFLNGGGIMKPYRYPFLVIYASLIHLVWGFLLLFSDNLMWTTPLGSFAVITSNHFAVGVMILVSTTLAVLHIYKLRDCLYWKYNTSLLIPQQIILYISAFSALLASWQGHYVDGVMRPMLFIFSDQFPTVILAILYTVAIIVPSVMQWTTAQPNKKNGD